MKGLIKTIPVTEVTKDNYYLITTEDNGIIISKVQIPNNEDAWPYRIKYKGNTFYRRIGELRTLVVECVLEKPLEHIERFPLHASQWQQAINNNWVDSNILCEFEIVDTDEIIPTTENGAMGYPDEYVQAAKLIQEKKQYTREEVIALIEKHSEHISEQIDYEGIQNATTAISYPEWDDKEWIKQNLK